MGYGVYEHRAYAGRFGGYDVPATCDFPECEAVIDRGLEFCCGGGPDATCGKYFCYNHQKEADYDEDDDYEDKETEYWQCPRCSSQAWDTPEYPKKKERDIWIEWVKTDDSWSQYRDENPGWEEEWRRSE